MDFLSFACLTLSGVPMLPYFNLSVEFSLQGHIKLLSFLFLEIIKSVLLPLEHVHLGVACPTHQVCPRATQFLVGLKMRSLWTSHTHTLIWQTVKSNFFQFSKSQIGWLQIRPVIFLVDHAKVQMHGIFIPYLCCIFAYMGLIQLLTTSGSHKDAVLEIH